MATDRGTGTGRFSLFNQHSLPSKKYRPPSAGRVSSHIPYPSPPPAPAGWPTAPTPPVPFQTSMHPPPRHSQPTFSCNICFADLTYRPRIQCYECPNYDICSTCYLTRQVPVPPHQSWHKQQTYFPATSIPRPYNPNAIFHCDGCGADISAAPRARCLECINMDLCGDCHIMKSNGPSGSGHAPTHKMNVITDLQPETTQRLLNDDYYPSNLYLDMIDAIFNFIHKHYNPPLGGGVGEANIGNANTNSSPSSPVSYTTTSTSSSTSRSVPGGAGPGGAGAGVLAQPETPIPREQRVEFEVLEPTKLARFYRAMGMKDDDNSYLASGPNLSKTYSRLGLEYILIPSPTLRKSLSDRFFPWQIDNIDTTPTEPALTRAGFRRSFVLGTFLNPEGTFFILQNLLSTGMLVNPITDVAFRSWVPRDTLPMRVLEELVEWEKNAAAGY